MADTSNLSNYLKDVADAIREKKGTEEQIPAANFDTEILNLKTDIVNEFIPASYEGYEVLLSKPLTSKIESTDVSITGLDGINSVGYMGCIIEGFTNIIGVKGFNFNFTLGFLHSQIGNKEFVANITATFKDVNNEDLFTINQEGRVVVFNPNVDTSSTLGYNFYTTWCSIRPLSDQEYQEYSDKILQINDVVISIEATNVKNYTMLDTSDATAKASDLILNKTAYVNGEKIIGSLKDYRGSGEEAVINYQMSVETNEPSPGTGNPTLEIIGQSMTTGVIGLQAQVRAKAGYSEVAKAIGLTADKLTKGNTILGVEGTADVGPITQEEYEECLLLSQQILGLVSI